MIYTISAKNCDISGKNLKLIKQHLNRLSDMISKFSVDLPLLQLVIRWHKKKDFYDGAVTLEIPKKRLYASFSGDSIEKAIQIGFERIGREIETYKGLHFSSGSKYYDRSTLEDALTRVLSRRKKFSNY